MTMATCKNPRSKTNFTFAAKCIGFASVLILLGCAAAPQTDTRAADEATIRRADADWVAAAQTKKVDGWMLFYAEDAVVLPPNEEVAADPVDIRKSVGQLLGLPGLLISWQPTKVEVAKSGDLAYLYGAYKIGWNDSHGKLVTDHGKNVEIWKKQPDGTWKCIVDTWNSDLPTVPAAPSN